VVDGGGVVDKGGKSWGGLCSKFSHCPQVNHLDNLDRCFLQLGDNLRDHLHDGSSGDDDLLDNGLGHLDMGHLGHGGQLLPEDGGLVVGHRVDGVAEGRGVHCVRVP